MTATPSHNTIRAVVVGSSTGGPVALDTMLKGIEKPLPVPMFVVQHMPPLFTGPLAERLNRSCSSTVVEGQDGVIAEPGTVYIAPGGRHMVVRPSAASAKIELHDGPLVNSCRPAVDELFASSLEVYGSEQLAVILTGMGYDGRVSSKALRDVGVDVYAQDEETSVVWGMPGAVVGDGLACKVLPIEQVGRTIAQQFSTTAVATSVTRSVAGRSA